MKAYVIQTVSDDGRARFLVKNREKFRMFWSGTIDRNRNCFASPAMACRSLNALVKTMPEYLLYEIVLLRLNDDNTVTALSKIN